MGESNGLTDLQWGEWLLPALNHLDQHALMLAKCSNLVHKAGIYPSGRVMMAQGTLHWDARSSHGISVEGEAVTNNS